MIIVGTYKLEDIIKTLDMTHKKHSSGNRASLSEYYLTDWILNWSAASAQTLTYNDGTFGISDGGGVISYPINRLTGVTKVAFKARRTGNTMYFDGQVFKIVNGEVVTAGNYSATLGTSWTEFEVDIDNDTVDYFEAYAGGGYGAYVEIKDVVFTVSSNGGGAGSGYIGNPLVSNKKMIGYNVPTSSAESTKTESVSAYSTNYVANQPKAGNGHARIKFLRSARELYVDDIQFINGNPTSYDDKNSNWLKGANIFFTYTGGGYSPANTLIPLGNGTKVNPNYNQFNYDSDRYNPWLAQTNCCVNVVDINIDSLNLTISYGEHYPFIFEDVRNSAYPAARFSGAIVGQGGYNSEMSAWDCQGQFLSGMDWSSLPTSGFADLDAIFKFLRERFKNINIYVDGEAWSLPSGDVTLEHFDSIAKNLDFSHNKDYRNTQGYPSGEATTIDDVPSEYYGTDWMLVVGQMNMEVPTYSDGVISLAKGSSSLFCTGVVYIPITRKTVKTLYLKLTISDGYRVGIGVAKIVNNVVTSTELYYNTSTGSDISLSLDVNDVVDYLMFSFGQQAVTISDIVFACE